ncbi:ADP-glucose pyrophosphorylase, partial [Haematococcus lacustris]
MALSSSRVTASASTRAMAGLPSALAESRRHPRMSRSHSKVVVCQAVQAEAKPVVTSSPKHAGADQPARVLSNAELETNKTVLGIILGGGAGTRLYPLTKKRAKPAVPLGANYRLIDIPVSNCLNSNITKMYCLTQFNSASLNRHLSQAY